MQKSLFRPYFSVFMRVLVPLYGLLIISTVSDQLISSKVETLLRSPTGTSNIVWAYALLSLIVSVIFPLMEMLVVGFGLWSVFASPNKRMELQDYFRLHFSQLLIEEMRSWGRCLLYSLFFVLPGLLQLLQLLFVPFVVLFDHDYAHGKIDALQCSRSIFRLRWVKTCLLVFVTYLLLPLLITLIFDSYRNYSRHPVYALLINLVETLITFIGIVFLYSIFKSSIKSIKDATMSGHLETPLREINE